MTLVGSDDRILCCHTISQSNKHIGMSAADGIMVTSGEKKNPRKPLKFKINYSSSVLLLYYDTKHPATNTVHSVMWKPELGNRRAANPHITSMRTGFQLATWYWSHIAEPTWMRALKSCLTERRRSDSEVQHGRLLLTTTVEQCNLWKIFHHALKQH